MENKPKILIFSTAYFPLVGGAEIAVKEITDRLIDFDFDLITARIDYNLPKFEKIGRVNVYRIGFGTRFDKLFLAFWGHIKAQELHKKNDYKAMWSIMASFAGLAGVKFKKKTNVPYLLTLQEGDDLKEVEKKANILGNWWKDIFKRADYVQCISNYLASWAQDKGVKSDSITVIPNGVDLDNFTFLEKIGDEGKKIVTASRLVYKNGLDLVIKALPFISSEIKFHVAGVGKEKDKLKQLAKELKIEDRVVWRGFIAHHELDGFLHEGDVFIRPSRSEGLGNSFLEAMACGVPTVGTMAGGIPDFLVHSQTGFIVKEDPKDIAEILKYILDNRESEKINNIKQTARLLIEKEYSWEVVASKMKKVFNDLL